MLLHSPTRNYALVILIFTNGPDSCLFYYTDHTT